MGTEYPGAAYRERLVEEHLGLVQRIAAQVHRVVRDHIELGDLVSLGTAGLIEAAARYEPASGIPFPAFAHRRVRGAMYDGIRKMGYLPRGHYRKRAAERSSEHAADITTDARGRPSRAADGAGADAATCAGEPATPGSRDTTSMRVAWLASPDWVGENLADPHAVRADDILARKRIALEISKVIATMPDSERHIIRRCYFEGTNMREAGAELGLSRSGSSRLHARAVARLRHGLGRLMEDDAM